MNFQSVIFEGAAGTASQLFDSNLPEIAFSGRSNVGKSSLLNKILGRKSLARVSATPGKTITVNFYRLDTARLVDLPGYGYAKRSHSEQKRWSDLVEGYFTSHRNIKLVVQLIDMRRAPSADDSNMLEFLKNSGFPFVVVLTKADKLNKTEFAERMDEFKKILADSGIGDPIPFSSLSGLGVEEIRRRIADTERTF